MDKYIADFFCKPLKLVIEVDGSSHNWEETVARDEKKQRDLEALGYTILRFTNKQVKSEMMNVSRVIEHGIRANHPDKIKQT